MVKPYERDIVIIGGGIIGCCSAYYLTQHPAYDKVKHRVTLIEAAGIASGASGKAGGLLGLWAYPDCIVPLSYKLHEELAVLHDGESRWGYRKITCGSLEATVQASVIEELGGGHMRQALSLHKTDGLRSKDIKPPTTLPQDLNWVSHQCSPQYSGMGNPSNTAQVHPYQFTTCIANLAKEQGTQIVFGSVSKIKSASGHVSSIEYIDNNSLDLISLPATDVVIAAGPWTNKLYPDAKVEAMRAHSVVVRPSVPISPYALFTSIDLPSGFGDKSDSRGGTHRRAETVSPEIYARPNNEAYACGAGDTAVPLPETSTQVAVDLARCQEIIDQVSAISDELRDGDILTKQACYLPLGGPWIGKTNTPGLLLAAGHTCWGIQNGPGTGKLISELVFDGKAVSANISSLDPRQA